ncbi:energy transducer TonB [Christiangramia aestuarii]|nr:energy transducer TonB [Christiangramia aestuarii]
MKRFFLFGFGLVSAAINAQDTIAYSVNSEIVDFKSPEVETYKILDAFEGSKYDSISQKYNHEGIMVTEKTFNWDAKKERRVYQGIHKHWYDSGKPFYTENYKDGKLDGNLVAYHENGKIRRKDRFKNGKLTNGHVWDEEGNELEHFPHFKRANFPGGKDALIAYLRNNIRLPEYIKTGETHKVLVKFTLDTEGKVAQYKILESPEDRFYTLETLRVLDAMPAWEPTELFGKQVNTFLTIPVVFRKG